MNRRTLIRIPLLLAFSSLSARAGSRDALGIVRAGGCGIMIRHALTVPGIGDPPEFALGDCSTQRNLSDAGREQSRRIGRWFRDNDLQPRHVYSSQWCRCRDTASLAFGEYTELTALNSTFAERSGNREPQTRALRAVLGEIPDGRFDVFVTHQVNISALTGRGASMGEGVVVDRAGQVMGSLRFGA
ncbi:MAG: histidine phosphatase family protein [Burkholderiales bacterium]|nr:MAG: histidine phosphatase family protein [Burkholderiales bacterium]